MTAPMLTKQVCLGKADKFANLLVIRLTIEQESNNARAETKLPVLF